MCEGTTGPDLPVPPQRHRARVRSARIGAWSDEQLVLEWRVSLAALQLDWSSIDVAAIADFRQRCLDELEHRHPQGFARWMRSGPVATGDPTPFVTDGPGTAYQERG